MNLIVAILLMNNVEDLVDNMGIVSATSLCQKNVYSFSSEVLFRFDSYNPGSVQNPVPTQCKHDSVSMFDEIP